jgi:hypothetical protein
MVAIEEGRMTDSNRIFGSGARLCVWILTLVLVDNSTVQGQTNRLEINADRLDIFVDGPRPVAEAVGLLARQFPYVVTYEDPIFEYSDDLRDVKRDARGEAASESVPRILVPKGSRFSIDYPLSSKTGEPPITTLLQSVLNASDSSGSGARFRIEQGENVFHIVPTSVRNAVGTWTAVKSILDAPITIRRQESSGSQMLSAICAAVTNATGVRVGIGDAPLNVTMNYRGVLESNGERARDVLIRTLHSIDERFSWLLLYGPSSNDRMYYLNVFQVVAPPGSQPLPPDAAPPPGLPPTLQQSHE